VKAEEDACLETPLEDEELSVRVGKSLKEL